ncbi:MAG: hypothetical protein ACI4P3_06660, partial [Candidatus Spyradosoma sp.]
MLEKFQPRRLQEIAALVQRPAEFDEVAVAEFRREAGDRLQRLDEEAGEPGRVHALMMRDVAEHGGGGQHLARAVLGGRLEVFRARGTAFVVVDETKFVGRERQRPLAAFFSDFHGEGKIRNEDAEREKGAESRRHGMRCSSKSIMSAKEMMS